MHFNNNDSNDINLGPQKHFKIYPVMSHLNRKFQNLYTPDQNIAIDVSDIVEMEDFIQPRHSVEVIEM
jgi:hypothetical protein